MTEARPPESGASGLPGSSDSAGVSDASGARRSRLRSRRRLAAPVAALAGAGCLVGAAAMPWWTRHYRDPLTGPVSAALRGSALVPALVPIALVVLAGLGAALLTRGVPRRIIGAAVALAGVAVMALSVVAAAQPDADRFAAELKRPADAVGAAAQNIGGPLLAVLGGVLAALAGVVIVIARGPVARRTSAYESPAARRARARMTTRPDSAAAVDGAELWRALDAGIDPTAADPDDIDRP
ncbi:MAG: Trp biosynthesis-associated membrane protein [Actinobacteria bacterium]|nr:Trp biosynthesis-associated membrane protein [Actinomycetota bacterium]